jgi:hypothetical protein
MKPTLAFILSLLMLASAHAQGPGPQPQPDPWILSGTNIWYPNGCVLIGSTLPTCAGGNTLVAAPSTTSYPGFVLTPGVAPTSPVNGAMWSTTAGFYGQAGGVTYGPFTAGTAGSFAATAPLAVTFPSSVVTYALNYNSTLTVSGGNLGINLSNANTWLAQTTIDLNATGLPSPLTGTILNLGQADVTIGRIQMNTFGDPAEFTGAVYGGTNASRTQVLSGAALTRVNAYAYNGAALSSASIATLEFDAAENIASGHQGSLACIETTPIASTTLTIGLCQQNDGSVTVGAAATAVGVGNLNLGGGALYNNGTAPSGTGAYVRAASPTVASLTVTGALTATGLVTNADLSNPATTVNGQTCTLGGTCTITASAGAITYGTTTAGTSIGIPYNTTNGGTLAALTPVSGGIVGATSNTTPAYSAALAQYGVVYGGGAGATPSATAAGTSSTLLEGGSPPSFVSTLPATVQSNITATGALAAGSLATGFTVVSPALGGTGTANNAANTITFSGNYSLGLTLTGATSVTLPTSGTLATTANINTAVPSATTSQIYGGTGGAGVAQDVSLGTHLSIATETLSTDATGANTALTIVARDGSGNFSAGTITAALTGTASNASQLLSATWAAPGTIGSATPNTGAFTTLSASSTANFTGSFEVGGYAMTFPAAAVNIGYKVGTFISGDCLQASGTAGGIADAGVTCGGGGGGGSPGGSNGTVQYNNSSAFGGISGVTSNGTSMTFATGDLIINGGSATAGIATVTSGGVVSSEAVATLAQGGLGGSQAGATAGQVPVYPGSGGAAVPTTLPNVTMTPPGGRLTTASGVAVMTSDVTAATTLYYAPSNTPLILIYNGTNVQSYNFTSGVTDTVGLSLALGSNWSASTLYDAFVTLNSGSPVLCTGPAWTSSAAGTSSRSAALATYAAQLTNSASMTCRISNSSTISVAANQGTYVGTVLINASGGQIDFKFGTLAAGGGAAVAGIWNAYNQTLGSFNVFDSNASWSVTTASTAQPMDGSTTNSVTFIVGSATSSIYASIQGDINLASTSDGAYLGLGLNSLSATWSRCYAGGVKGFATGVRGSQQGSCSGYGVVGLNYLQGIQFATSTSDLFLTSTPPYGGIIARWWW